MDVHDRSMCDLWFSFGFPFGLCSGNPQNNNIWLHNFSQFLKCALWSLSCSNMQDTGHIIVAIWNHISLGGDLVRILIHYSNNSPQWGVTPRKENVPINQFNASLALLCNVGSINGVVSSVRYVGNGFNVPKLLMLITQMHQKLGHKFVCG